MQRAAITSFASALFKFKECYDSIYKQLGIENGEAKALAKLIPVSKLEELRNIAQHVIDRKTGRIHTPQKIVGAFREIEKAFPDPFGENAKQLIVRISEFRDSILTLYPDVEIETRKRHKEFLSMGN